MDVIHLFGVIILINGFTASYIHNVRTPKDDIVINMEQNTNKRKSDGSNSYFKTVCYYPMTHDLNATVKNPMPPGLDANLCSHVIFIPIGIDKNNRLVPATSSHAQIFRRVIPIMRRQNPRLKILASSCNPGWEPVLESWKNMSEYVNSALDFMKTYDFDGLDLDWEFPTHQQAHNLSIVLMELRRIFDIDTAMHKRPKYLLTVAVSAIPSVADEIYEIDSMKKPIDFVNMMGYDYHGWSQSTPYTEYNSPLIDETTEKPPYCLASSAMYWALKIGFDKVVVGVPFYCHAYKLLSPKEHGYQAFAVGFGECNQQDYTCACLAIKNKNGISVWDDVSKVPYCYYGDQWITYDNEKSITAKTKWIQGNGFAGIMTWNMKADDYAGICDGKTKYPLMKSVLRTISSN